MTRRAMVWLVVAALFTLVNLVFAGIVVTWHEPMHALLHLALGLLGAYAMWRLAPRRQPYALAGDASAALADADLTDRLAHLEQSVDTVAIEVERIGEGQRFMTRLFTESGTAPAPAEGGARQEELAAREAPPGAARGTGEP